MSFLLKYCTRPAATDTQPFQKAADPRVEDVFGGGLVGGGLGAGIGGLLGYGTYGLTRLFDDPDVSPEDLQARRLSYVGLGTGLGLSQGVRSGVRAVRSAADAADYEATRRGFDAYRDNQPQIDWKRVQGDALIERGIMPKRGTAPALKVPKIGQTPTTAVDAANIEAIRRILAVSAAAGGAGVLTAGLANFGTLAGRPQSVLPSSEPVTVKLIDESPTAKRPWHGLRPAKPLPWITMSGQRTKLGQATAAPSTLQTVAQGLYDNVIKPTGLHHFSDPALPTTSAGSKLWGVPGMAAAGTLSLVGGYTATDWLLKRRRDAGMERELDSAEKDYLAALSQLSTAGRKQAGEVDATAGKAVAAAAPGWLKQLYDAGAAVKPPVGQGLEPLKSYLGLPMQTAADLAGGLGATWTALATIPAIPAGVGMYNFMRDSGERKALQEAIALRRRMRQHTAPPAIQLVPQG